MRVIARACARVRVHVGCPRFQALTLDSTCTRTWSDCPHVRVLVDFHVECPRLQALPWTLPRARHRLKAFTPPNPLPSPIVRSPAYYRRRFADLWLASRIRGVYEPVAVAVTCVWLTYGAQEVFRDPAKIRGEVLALIIILGVSLLSRWAGSSHILNSLLPLQVGGYG